MYWWGGVYHIEGLTIGFYLNFAFVIFPVAPKVAPN